MKIILFSPQCPPRLHYIANFISREICDSPCVITGIASEYSIAEGGIKINYSDNPITDNEIWIKPSSLLFENNIQPQAIECFLWGYLKVFFKTEGDIPFDIFAASFYLLSRYEEYLPHPLDVYSRFAHTSSLAFKENFLHQPLINLWIEKLLVLMKQKFSALQFPDKNFQFVPTYDIDIAYAYRHKSFIYTAGGFLKNIANPAILRERTNVLLGRNKDPFDVYDWLHAVHSKYHLHPIYFFLAANKRGRYDKNIAPDKKAMQQLIHQHKNKYSIGIHPSWQSGDSSTILQNEIATLAKITGTRVQQSRQHYIRMQMPHTYRKLIKQGIQHDYSMGYGSINGFRASVATSFYWYDLLKEKQTTLCIHSFCFMDTNAIFGQNYSTIKAAEELQQYHDIVKLMKGSFITIFHNHFLTEQAQWLPWRKMYADFLNKNFN